VVARPVEPVEPLLAVLLHPDAELRLEAVRRLVADEDEVLAGLRHADVNAGDGSRALFGGAEERLAAEEAVGEGGGVVVLAPRPRPPRPAVGDVKLLRLGDDG